jgi:hypothetical protein
MSISKYWWHEGVAIPIATLTNTKALAIRTYLDNEVVNLVPYSEVGRYDGEYVVQRYGVHFAQIILNPTNGLAHRKQVATDHFLLKLGKDLFVESIPFGTVRLYPDGMLYSTHGSILGFVMLETKEHKRAYNRAMESIAGVSENSGGSPPPPPQPVPPSTITTAVPVMCPMCKRLTVKRDSVAKFSKNYSNQLFTVSYPKMFFEVWFADGHAQITTEVVVLNFFPATHAPKAGEGLTTTVTNYKLPHAIAANIVTISQVVFVDNYKITATTGGVVQIILDEVVSPGHQLIIF